jgi:hypothetical protein
MNSKRYLTVNSPKLSALSDETSVDSDILNSLSDEENSKLNSSTRTNKLFTLKLQRQSLNSKAQNIYNLRLLYYIKTTLGYGRVLKLESKKLAFFYCIVLYCIITNRNILKEQIFPIFDKYLLYSSNIFLRFKEV